MESDRNFRLTNFSDEDSTLFNVTDNRNKVYYDSNSSTNNWLGDKTYTLTDGGKLTRIISS